MATTLSPSIRARSAQSSPTRPTSSYSTASTIRRVTPSPESLTDALRQSFAAHSTPKRRRSSATLAPDRSYSPTPGGRHTRGKQGTTAQDRGSPVRRTNARRMSPRKEVPRPLSFPTGSLEEYQSPRSRPETPSPVSEEQRRSRYSDMTTSDHTTTGGGRDTEERRAGNSRAGSRPAQGLATKRSGLVRIQRGQAQAAEMDNDVAETTAEIPVETPPATLFAGIRDMEVLEEERRMISVGASDGRGKQRCCAGGCAVM